MDETITEIKTLSKKGYGQSEDIAGNIMAAIPGEKGYVKKITGRGKKSLYLLEGLIEKSKDRVTPRCKHFTACGGCVFQHISYERQLKDKEAKIKALFPDNQLEPIVGMDDPWNYRGKMEFTFSENKDGEKFIGLIKPKSRGLVENLTDCHLVDPWCMDILDKVRAYWAESGLQAYRLYSNTGTFQTLTVRKAVNTNSRMITLTVSGNADFAMSKKQMNDFVKAIDDEECAIFIDVKCISKGSPTRYYEMHLSGPDFFEEKIGDTLFKMSPKAFFQPNPKIAEKFFSSIKSKLNLTGKEKILDLFSGIGTISILLSAYAEKIVAVEIGKEAVCDAKHNLELLNINNVEIFADDVSNFIKTRGIDFTPDIVIIDPPRAGMGKVALNFLEKLKPEKIVYLSCNPTTQQEDISKLESYRIESIQPFDQFPQTPHVESLVILKQVL